MIGEQEHMVLKLTQAFESLKMMAGGCLQANKNMPGKE